MNIIKKFQALTYILATAIPSFAAPGSFKAGALSERLSAAVESPRTSALPSLYDGSSFNGGAQALPTAMSHATPGRSGLDAPRVTRVNHRHKPGEIPAGDAVLRGKGSLERGYAWTMHPATALLESNNTGLKVAGFALGVVLFVPALILAGLNHIASNSRLTKGTSWHRHD